MRKYFYGNTPQGVPLGRSSWAASEDIISAGFDPEDGEVAVVLLAEDWNGHPAGSRVITGNTMPGLPFSVID